MTLIGYRELMELSLEDDVPEPRPVPEPSVTVLRPGKVKGVWRQKRMKAPRRPLYVHAHDERHLWLMAR